MLPTGRWVLHVDAEGAHLPLRICCWIILPLGLSTACPSPPWSCAADKTGVNITNLLLSFPSRKQMGTAWAWFVEIVSFFFQQSC